MSTTIRPVLSTRNPYWIEKHRYYELKHFCMQYPLWKKRYLDLDSLSKTHPELLPISKISEHSDPTASCAAERESFFKRMKLIEQAALEADSTLASYILKGVTEGISYDVMKARLEIPCGKEMYYDIYRRFFWLLDKARN